MTEIEKQLAFASFCIEEYKTEHRVSGCTVANEFASLGVVDYLIKHYDILHSMSREELLNDIARFIEVHREAK